MTEPIAYVLKDVRPGVSLTFCPLCAFRCTAMGLITAGLGIPSDMDDAIARMALAQIERGLTIDTPEAVRETDVTECESCSAWLGAIPAQEESA